MAKRRKNLTEIKIERPRRMKLTAAESLRRVAEFSKRKEKFIAAVLKGKNRGLSA